jgi:hypothetical protein
MNFHGEPILLGLLRFARSPKWVEVSQTACQTTVETLIVVPK